MQLNPRASWEDSVAAFCSLVLEPAGFEIRKISRVPYLCQGDPACNVYMLDDAIFVLAPTLTSLPERRCGRREGDVGGGGQRVDGVAGGFRSGSGAPGSIDITREGRQPLVLTAEESGQQNAVSSHSSHKQPPLPPVIPSTYRPF